MSDHLDLEAIKQRADAATEGPWEALGRIVEQSDWTVGYDEIVSCEVDCGSYCQGGTGKGVIREADAKFIAHARTDIPDLLAEVERLRDLCEEKDAAFQYATHNARKPTPCEISELRKRQVERSVAQVKRLTTELNNHRESLNNQRREYRKLLAKRDTEVERLSGIVERVRGLKDIWFEALENPHHLVLFDEVITDLTDALETE